MKESSQGIHTVHETPIYLPKVVIKCSSIECTTMFRQRGFKEHVHKQIIVVCHRAPVAHLVVHRAESLSVDNSVGPTHCSYKSRVIPVSFVCEWGVGEVGHLVRDLEVLLCPFPLGNKSCPVKSKLVMSITMSINYLSLG